MITAKSAAHACLLTLDFDAHETFGRSPGQLR